MFPLANTFNLSFDTELEVPNEDVLCHFMDSLLELTGFSAHYALAIQIYLAKLLNHAGLELHASNWKWLLIGLTLVVSNMSVDWGFASSSYAAGLSVDAKGIDELERQSLPS